MENLACSLIAPPNLEHTREYLLESIPPHAVDMGAALSPLDHALKLMSLDEYIIVFVPTTCAFKSKSFAETWWKLV